MSRFLNALQITQYGGAEAFQFTQLPLPQPGPSQVLIAIRAIGTNPVDFKTRAGKGVAGRIQSLPFTLGWDVSGTVVAVGEGAELAPGTDVFGMVNFPLPGGAYASHVLAPASELTPKPAYLSHEQAAALPLAALTAYQALFEFADLQAGQTVLIHAAAGGVGHLAVQLASRAGAHVIGTGSARNEGFVRGLGATEFIDYTKQPFEEAVQNVDVVLEQLGAEVARRSVAVLRPGGALVSIVGGVTPELIAAHPEFKAASILVRAVPEHLKHLAELAAKGASASRNRGRTAINRGLASPSATRSRPHSRQDRAEYHSG